MNEDMQKMLIKLAEGLHTTAGHLFDVLKQQALISAVSDVVFVVAVSYLLARSKPKESADLFYRGVWLGALFIVCLVAWLAAESLCTALYNPEYWALKQLLVILK